MKPRSLGDPIPISSPLAQERRFDDKLRPLGDQCPASTEHRVPFRARANLVSQPLVVLFAGMSLTDRGRIWYWPSRGWTIVSSKRNWSGSIKISNRTLASSFFVPVTRNLQVEVLQIVLVRTTDFDNLCRHSDDRHRTFKLSTTALFLQPKEPHRAWEVVGLA